MSATIKSLGIDRLDRAQQLALVQEIWDLIATEAGPPLLNESQRHELARRGRDDEAAPADVVPWEQVKAETLAQLRRP